MSRQLNFRIGNIAPSGRGKPFTPNTKTYNAVCSTGYAPSTVSGSVGQALVLNCMDYNNPLRVTGTGTSIKTGTFTADVANQHPTGHEESIADGFDEAQVLSSLYRFSIWWTGTQDAREDFIFAYKFANHDDIDDYDTGDAATGSNTGRLQWHHMRMTRGWVWKRFSATDAGGSIYPSAGVVEIKIPSTGKLAYGMTDAIQADLDADVNNLSVNILDTTVEQIPKVTLFLHAMIFSIGGNAMGSLDWLMDVDWFGKVKVMRDIDKNDMIDEVDNAV